MNLYLAGNFPWLKNPELEKEGRRLIESQGLEYKRLVSFYFLEDVETILKVKRENINGKH
jgi:hypothetical protein